MLERLSAFKHTALDCVLLLCGYYVLLQLLLQFGNMPEQAFYGSFILLAAFQNAWLYGLVLIALMVGLTWYRREDRFALSWQTMPSGNMLRLIVGLIAFLLAWMFSSYDYNLYFDSSHWPDRLLLLLFFGMILWKPLMVLPFLLVLIPIISQFHYPIGGYSVADSFPLMKMLVAFVAMLALSTLLKRDFGKAFFVLILCIQASGYWISGTGKFSSQWLLTDNIYYLLPATYANGWLAFLSQESLSQWTQWLGNLNWPMKIGTLMLEVGALFVLLRRNLTLLLLIGWISFHVGVFLVSGIAFWRWGLLELLILGLLIKYPKKALFQVYSKSVFAVSLVLILGASIWFKPVKLSWHDSKVNYTYLLEGIGESGKTYNLSPEFFQPYEYQFTQSPFAYLSSEKQLNVVWGATGRKTAKALQQVRSAEDLFALEESTGKIFFNEKKTLRFEKFIRTFVSALNKEKSKRTWWESIQAPHLLQTFNSGVEYDGTEKINSITVTQLTTFYDEKKYKEIRRRPVRTIAIER